jgi:hypothetical protein
MPKVLKIDLHTHPIAALKDKMGIQGIRDINREVAAEIVKAIKVAGLNGIAITENNNFNHGWVACLEIMENFRSENLVIIPGAEVVFKGQQFLQLYIPGFYRRRIPFFKGKEWFYILTHPGLDEKFDLSLSSQMDFDAVEEKSLKGDFPVSHQIAISKNIPLVQSSDSVTLQDLGKLYMEF